MTSAILKSAVDQQLPILFAHIGWAKYYDGTEPINGNFSWLKDNPNENFERNAFWKADNGYFYCGVGRGTIAFTKQLHVAFVARDPSDQTLKVVGIYAAATVVSTKDSWAQVRTKNTVLLPDGPRRRPVGAWPGKQGIRRWAWRGGTAGSEHRSLNRVFDQVRHDLAKGHRSAASAKPAEPTDELLAGFDGKEKWRFVKHRKREARLRHAKLREALRLNSGHLICEVPKCRFDFGKRYGVLGMGYAQVHHKKPLNAAPKKGQRVLLKDLAVVCANCHVMIHKGGACHPLGALIP